MRHYVRPRRAIAIWIVLCICIVIGIGLYALVASVIGTKAQSRHTFVVLRAKWLAHAAVQHALLKFRVLPNESYEASALARGVCPFSTSSDVAAGGTVNTGPLDVFSLDINTGEYPLTDQFPDAEGEYEVDEMMALNSFNNGDIRVHVVQIKGIGTVQGNVGGKVVDFREELIKVVNVERDQAM